MEKLSDTLEWFFKEVAGIKVDEKKGELEITIGTTTLMLTLPEVIGAYNEPKD